ncbi:MAG: SIMPL domain-containing protein [Spirochaetaceae bacterium]|jgi:hypothetical protein|nr:SIMPL domain-containing protein [Spirochaetaceae bacterium]
MKEYVKTLIVCVSVVICVLIFSANLISFKTAQNNYITVTGSATKSFTSDLIVWRGSFSKEAKTSKDAYDQLKNNAFAVKSYLIKNNINENEIIFSSIRIQENYHHEYNYEGRLTNTIFTGYTLTQSVKIESNDVDKIEQISRDITELIDLGVEFLSMAPEYYYTKLDELKLNLIVEATENSRIRAETIAKEAGAKITKLKSANLGVFQIIAENSPPDSYSSGGAFDIFSKNKTAFITTKLEYLLK